MLWCIIIGLVEVGVANGIRNQLASGNMDMLYAISTDTPAIDNEYVRVFKNFTTSSEPMNALFGARVIVALGKMTITSSKGSIALDRGNVAVFQENDTYSISNGQFFEILFKKNHPPLKKPEQWLEPLKNTTVYEDEQIRIFEERLAPGDDRELHSHAQRVVVRLNEVQLTDPRFYPVGQTGTGIQVPNTVRFAEPVVHVVRNLSNIPLFNIVVEFKIPH
jgi:hypothetical protein